MKKIKDLMTQRVKLADVYPGKAKELGLGKDAEFVRKFFVAKSMEYDEADDAIIGVISTATMDRDNEILDPKGADLSDYNKNRTVCWAHGYGELPVGTNMWLKIKKTIGIIAKTIFAPAPEQYRGDWFPDTVKHMMKTGHLRAFSVGFVPLEYEDIELKDGDNPLTALRRIYTKWLLLEYSIVPVPSNPDALMAMVKSGEIHDLKMVEDMGINKKQIGINKGEEKVKEKLYLEKSKAVKDTDKTLVLEAGIELVYGVGTDGDVVVRGLLFDPERFDEKSAGEWYAAHKYIEEIVGDEAIKGDDGMPTNEALHDLYVRTMVLTRKGTLGDAMKAGKYNCECIICGYTLSSDSHCSEISCPECGGEMRRLERPGPGKDGEGTAKNKGSLGAASGAIPPVEGDDKDGDDKGPGEGDKDDEGDKGEGDDEGKDNTDGEGDDNDGSGEGDGDGDEAGGDSGDGGEGDEGGEDDKGGEEGAGDSQAGGETQDTDGGDGEAGSGGEGGGTGGDSGDDNAGNGSDSGGGSGDDDGDGDEEPEFDAEGEEIFEIVTDAGKPVARKDLKNLLSELLSEKLFNGVMEKAFKDTLEDQLIKMLEAAGLVAKEKKKKIIDKKKDSGTFSLSDPEFADEEEAMAWLTETDEGQKFMLEIYQKEAGRVT